MSENPFNHEWIDGPEREPRLWKCGNCDHVNTDGLTRCGGCGVVGFNCTIVHNLNLEAVLEVTSKQVVAKQVHLSTDKEMGVIVILAVDDVARLFCEMRDEDQAHFFNLCGAHFNSWGEGTFRGEMQLAFLTRDDGILVEEGREFMRALGAYAEEDET